jgi:hypothetical protein
MAAPLMSNATTAVAGTMLERPPVLGSCWTAGIVSRITLSLVEVLSPAVVGHSIEAVVSPVVVVVVVSPVVVVPVVVPVVSVPVVVVVVPSKRVRTRVPSDMGGPVVASAVVVSVGVPVVPVVVPVVPVVHVSVVSVVPVVLVPEMVSVVPGVLWAAVRSHAPRVSP